MVDRFAARERALWEELAMRMYPTTPHELAQALAVAAKTATGPQRTLTLARYAILVEAGIHPAMRAHLLSTGARVNTWFMTWLRVAGSTDPERDAPIIMNHYTGVVLHDLAIPDPAFDPTDADHHARHHRDPPTVRGGTVMKPRPESGRPSTPSGPACATCSPTSATTSGGSRRSARAGPCATSPPT